MKVLGANVVGNVEGKGEGLAVGVTEGNAVGVVSIADTLDTGTITLERSETEAGSRTAVCEIKL